MSTLSITLIQAALHWEDPEANRRMFQQKIESVSHKMELVVLPEAFNTGFSMRPEQLAETMDGPTMAWMRELAHRKKIILTGSVFIRENDQYFNRLLWVLPNGQVGHYDKRHLFAYAGEHEHFTAGSRRFIASVKGWRIFLQVCYDLRFPVWSRQQLTRPVSPDRYYPTGEYDILLNVANWPERRNLAWKTLLAARAIENQCYVVGVNRIGEDGNGVYHSGDSRVIDPLGEILYEKTNDADIHTIVLEKSILDDARTKLPFLNDADSFTILKDNEDA